MRDRFEEHVPGGVVAGVLGSVAAVMVGLTLAQLTLGPLGSDPAPTWFYAALAGLFLLVTRWFARLHVRLDADGVYAAYGPFRRRVAWRDVERVEEDRPEAFYGGWGVRFWRREGRPTLVFNVIGGRHVAVVARQGAGSGLVFATREPDRALAVAQVWLERARGSNAR